MRHLRRLGLALLAGIALTSCFYSLDGSLVGKQRDGANDAFLDAAVVEQGPAPDGSSPDGGADQTLTE